jgi:hypothetical protein
VPVQVLPTGPKSWGTDPGSSLGCHLLGPAIATPVWYVLSLFEAHIDLSRGYLLGIDGVVDQPCLVSSVWRVRFSGTFILLSSWLSSELGLVKIQSS